jgi:hypothetical protein
VISSLRQSWFRKATTSSNVLSSRSALQFSKSILFLNFQAAASLGRCKHVQRLNRALQDIVSASENLLLKQCDCSTLVIRTIELHMPVKASNALRLLSDAWWCWHSIGNTTVMPDLSVPCLCSLSRQRFNSQAICKVLVDNASLV